MFWFNVLLLIAVNCTVEQDHYGAGISTTQCTDGYVARTEKDHYGGGTPFPARTIAAIGGFSASRLGAGRMKSQSTET
jgi:hypothetical protein